MSPLSWIVYAKLNRPILKVWNDFSTLLKTVQVREDFTISICVVDRSKHNYVSHNLEILGKTKLIAIAMSYRVVSCMGIESSLWHYYIVDGFLVIGYSIASSFIGKWTTHNALYPSLGFDRYLRMSVLTKNYLDKRWWNALECDQHSLRLHERMSYECVHSIWDFWRHFFTSSSFHQLFCKRA